jgi:CAI-1 autoinducer synthase
LSVNAALTQEQLEKIVSVCAAIREQVQLHLWPSTRRRGDTGPAVRRQRRQRDERDEMAVAA